MRKQMVIGLVLLAFLSVITVYQGKMLGDRPIEIKLGPVISTTLVRLFAADHATTLAFRTTTGVMFYFGSFFDNNSNLITKSPEYHNMYQHLVQAVKLDPYNMDAYYFAQAAFTWEIGRIKEVNRMLEYGMRYRTWDYLLPFYAGFNSAFFLKDYVGAAHYYKQAAELSESKLYINLAARYFNEAGQTELGVAYLESMIETASDQKTKAIYQQRRDALLAITVIEKALNQYRSDYGHKPKKLSVLVDRGLLGAIPDDPYKGKFYVDGAGRVRTTSKFALVTPTADSSSEKDPQGLVD